MKVKCVKLVDARGREVNDSAWLTLERVYPVLGIFVDPDGRRSYQIITNDRDPGFAAMVCPSAECFEIVSTTVPSNWRLKIRENGVMSIAPGAWQEPGFLEAFYDRDPAVYPIFERERDLILSEDP
jgi:hypothetical protein